MLGCVYGHQVDAGTEGEKGLKGVDKGRGRVAVNKQYYYQSHRRNKTHTRTPTHTNAIWSFLHHMINVLDGKKLLLPTVVPDNPQHATADTAEFACAQFPRLQDVNHKDIL